MNANQYLRLCENSRRWGPAGLGESSRRETARAQRRGRPQRDPLAIVVGRAARNLRRREAVVRAWQRCAEPAWLDVTEVVEAAGDSATISVVNPVLASELRRQHRRLLRRLSQLVPGIRRINFECPSVPLMNSQHETDEPSSGSQT